ncbi:MAG: efflux RND transporter periplasmic adaptor subunit [Planctomycetota bacterium]|nr:efflux RND transporter periplasmic adaptor subunit [Planctomycetota bacterium]
MPNWISRVIVISIIVGVGVAVFLMYGETGQEQLSSDSDDAMTHIVARSDFEAFVTETGDVASASNREVRCEVQALGTPGTLIIEIVDEGTYVEEGDFIVEFDSSALENDETAQKIVVANNNANLIQAQSQLENAERTLKEFEKGLYQQELTLIESEVFVAQESVQRSLAKLDHSQRLAASGFLSSVQLNADRFQWEKAKRDLKAAELKLTVYREFTKEKLIGEYTAAIKQKQAQVDAAQSTLDLATSRLVDIQEQIKNCKILAPASGQVVYADDERRNVIIEEGAVIRDNQVVVRLPDIQNMEVAVRINESHINRVVPGQIARIELDADPDNPLEGEVNEVAAYPFPLRWHGAPLEYDTKVTIKDPPTTLRPGLRAKVKIYFESEADVIQVPLAAVIQHEQLYFCLVKDGQDWAPRPVTIGPNNNTHVIVSAGLNEGEMVTLTPFRFIQRSELEDYLPTLNVKAKPTTDRELVTVENN